jgi:hypothetical protein
MPQTRKKVRDGMTAALAAAGTGFNARFAAIAAAYGCEAFTVDFGEGSQSVFFGFLPAEQIGISDIEEAREGESDIAFVVYTTRSANTHHHSGPTFSGDIEAHVDVHLRLREGAIRDGDVESICEAIEDAVVSCFEDATWPAGVHFAGNQQQSEFPPIALTGDGAERTVQMLFMFQVDAN